MMARRCPTCDELVIGLDECPKGDGRHARCCLATGRHAPRLDVGREVAREVVPL